MFTQLTNVLITSITNLYIETGLIGIFMIMALENCYVPLPASEVVIPIAGALITTGESTLLSILAGHRSFYP
ncbi:hypothetical protein ccbrp13_39560 [Ktedonobacteria bacterium brp13]|nr:hypothetical protein ccbrp13_39560 [Ktedonobacteria bacterium brp13]